MPPARDRAESLSSSPDHRGARARGRGPTPPPHRPLRPPADRPGPARGNEDGHERPRVRGIRRFDPVRTRVTPIPSLVLVTDRHATEGRELVAVVTAALDAGLPAVQLREKDLPGRQLLEIAEQLRTATARTGALLLVNDRIDVALAVGADGVHLGGTSVPVAVARSLVGPEGLIGVSTHAPDELRALIGADFAFFGAVYATPGKPASLHARTSFSEPKPESAIAFTGRAERSCRRRSIPLPSGRRRSLMTTS